MNSYSKINYKLRPQKCIERKLFSNFINEVSNELKCKFNYIGMGSLYYADHLHFYKNCNIENLLSIEDMYDKNGNYDKLKCQRFNNNIPLHDIKLIAKKTSDAINDFDYSKNNFIWFDYDGCLEPYMIKDVDMLSNKVKETTVLAVTINLNYHKRYLKSNTVNTKRMFDDFKEYADSNLVEKAFLNSEYEKTILRLFNYIIEYNLRTSNALQSQENQKIESRQHSIIKYKDGSCMITILWVLLKNENINRSFSDTLDNSEIKGSKDLSIGHITNLEKRMLDLYRNDNYKIISQYMGIEEADIEKYYELQKYIPDYAEVIT